MNWMREPDSEPIPGYRLIQPLGSGGFGEVWKCEAPGGIHKAIKFVYGNLNSLDVDAARAEQELNALERVKEVRHPFVCSLDRIEVADGELVIVMELCDKTLHDVFKESQSAGLIGIPRDNLLRFVRDAAEALDYMNEKHKLQHLDVKPKNLFVVGDRVKVADFGLVKHLERLSGSGIMGGVTPLYSAPETYNGKITEHTDQYSLAIVYQELLTGHRPYTGNNVRQIAQQHLQAEPDLRALPEAERPVLARALAKDPTQRFPNCLAFVSALFRARAPVKKEQPKPEPALVGQGSHLKTLTDTLEDIFLEEPFEIPSEAEINFGEPPPSHDSGENHLEISQLGVTIAQPETGSLRPTLFIGVGNFGRKALLELRCRFVDRFGDLGKTPMFRFLCIDPDPEALNVGVKGAPEVALARSEIHLMPLQPVTNYRRRIIDQLSEWLPREKLYSMPRSLQPQGSRALGRLAFVDNHQRLLARLRRDIQEITNPDVMYQSVSQTGLALRDSTPRICVLASASGGSGGMLADLGYGLRRLLSQMRHPDAELNLFLMCSSPGDPASPKSELANVYATLTEINHFSDPMISFAAEYGVDGQRIVDQGTPAGSVYLLPLPHRGPIALEDTIAHLGSFLFHEVTTPLGIPLSDLRNNAKITESGGNDIFATPFRSLGTYTVWFPRGLLLRLASRIACRKLIENWVANDESGLATPDFSYLDPVCRQFTDNPALEAAALSAEIEAAAREANLTDLAASPAEAMTEILVHLEEQSIQSVALEDPGSWARQALNRIREWVGIAASENQQFQRTRINRAFHVAAKKVAETRTQTLGNLLNDAMKHAGQRMAAAEWTLDQLDEYCAKRAFEQKTNLEQSRAKTSQSWQHLDRALAECLADSGGFRLFGGKSRRRQLQSFMEKLSNFSRQRLHEELLLAVQHVFVALRGHLDDLRRDLGFCRQRLRHLQENLDSPLPEIDEDITATRPGSDLTVSRTPVASTEDYWEAIRQSNTARVMLPDGEEELEKAAAKLLHRLSAQDWEQVDNDLHERVVEPSGGLFAACMQNSELSRNLAMPLMEETISLLGEFLPVMDVSQILAEEFGFTFEDDTSLDRAPSISELVQNTEEYLHRAAPMIARANDSLPHSFLLVPASAAGAKMRDAISGALPAMRHVNVPGQSDMMFCCDQGPLSHADLRELFKPCRKAYEELAPSPVTSPHGRFDITDWIPLDP